MTVFCLLVFLLSRSIVIPGWSGWVSWSLWSQVLNPLQLSAWSGDWGAEVGAHWLNIFHTIYPPITSVFLHSHTAYRVLVPLNLNVWVERPTSYLQQNCIPMLRPGPSWETMLEWTALGTPPPPHSTLASHTTLCLVLLPFQDFSC